MWKLLLFLTSSSQEMSEVINLNTVHWKICYNYMFLLVWAQLLQESQPLKARSYKKIKTEKSHDKDERY